jgi:TRAP-type uncharacterized transport system fused permease subunit
MMLTWKYSLPAFVVPFAFTLEPRGLGLLLQGGWADILQSSVTAIFGVAGVAMGLGGWLIGASPMSVRALATAGGLSLFYPAPAADLLGAAGVIAALLVARARR